MLSDGESLGANFSPNSLTPLVSPATAMRLLMTLLYHVYG